MIGVGLPCFTAWCIAARSAARHTWMFNAASAANVFTQMTQEEFFKIRKGDKLVPADGSPLADCNYWCIDRGWHDNALAIIVDCADWARPRPIPITQLDLHSSVDQTGRAEIFPAEYWPSLFPIGTPVMLSVRVLETFTDFPNPLLYNGHEQIAGNTYVKVGDTDNTLGYLLANIVKIVPYVP